MQKRVRGTKAKGRERGEEREKEWSQEKMDCDSEKPMILTSIPLAVPHPRGGHQFLSLYYKSEAVRNPGSIRSALGFSAQPHCLQGRIVFTQLRNATAVRPLVQGQLRAGCHKTFPQRVLNSSFKADRCLCC